MNDPAFDSFTRHAAARISRRTSFLALGGASMAAALGGPLAADGKDRSNQKVSKKAKRRANQKCKKQVTQCQIVVAQVGSTQQVLCCQFLSNCEVTAFIQCLSTN